VIHETNAFAAIDFVEEAYCLLPLRNNILMENPIPQIDSTIIRVLKIIVPIIIDFP